MKLRTLMAAAAAASPLLVTATTTLPSPVPSVESPPLVAVDGGRLEARGCMEAAAVVSVKPSRASAELPVGYKPKSNFNLPGDATMIIGVTRCQAGVLNGVELKDGFILGERMLEVEPRNGVRGHHFYSIGQVTDNPDIAAWLQSAGYPIQLDPHVLAKAGIASARSAGDGVAVRIKLAFPLPLPIESVSIWREGSAGRTVLTKIPYSVRTQIGLGYMTVDPGIPFGAIVNRLVGRSSTHSIGMINRVGGYTGTLTLLK